MAVTLDEFVKRLSASGIFTDDEVHALRDEHQKESQKPIDTQTFARTLVQTKRLTKYQAAAIYQGKTKGLVLGNYVILDKLGAGGMGQVYKALHRRMERVVALKVLPAEAMKSPENVQRFHREVKAAARLEHPNIVTAYDADEADGMHFLVMQFADGKDLSDLIKANGPLPVPQAVECIRQAALGLAYAHKHGVIHRDIKPANLLLDNDGTVKILDMGLARLESQIVEQTHGDGLTQSGQIMGTVDYMSPEQAEETRGVDHRTDIYSLGCTLYVLLVGRPMFQATTTIAKLMAHQTQPAPSLRASRADVPEAVEAIYQKMVAKDPGARYASMDECVAELETCLGQAAPTQLDRPASSDTALTSFLQQIAGEKNVAIGAPPKTNIAAETINRQPVKEETGTRHEQPPIAKPPMPKAMKPGLAKPADVARAKTGTKPKHARAHRIASPAVGLLLIIAMSVVALLVLLGSGAGILYITGVFGSGVAELADSGEDARPGDAPIHANYALEFDGLGSYVEAPPMEFGATQPFTIEATISPYDYELNATSGNTVVSNRRQLDSEQLGFVLKLHQGKVDLVLGTKQTFGSERRRHAIAQAAVERQKRVHVAGVFDPTGVRVYVDGKAQGRDEYLGLEHAGSNDSPILIGVDNNLDSLREFFHGTIDEVRISNIARYDKDFTPPGASDRFAPDEHTLALYHFDEGQGDVLKDSSGNDHHGKIVGAKWVRVDPPKSDAWIVLFDGDTTDLWQSLGPFQIDRGARALVAYGKGMAVSRDTFDDFDLEFQWKVSPGGNGGVFYRSPATTTGMGTEYQLVDNVGHPNGRVPITRAGSLYNKVAPQRDATNPAGEWNDSRIVCRGKHVEHWMNGERVLTYDAEQIGTDLGGHILLQALTGTIWFKDIRVRP